MRDSVKLQGTMRRNRKLQNLFYPENSRSFGNEPYSQDTIGDQITNDSIDLFFFNGGSTNDSEEITGVPSCSPSSSSQPSYSQHPSYRPTNSPSQSPSFSSNPSLHPTTPPSQSASHSSTPSQHPSKLPSQMPSAIPSSVSSTLPSIAPTLEPSIQPSKNPTAKPTLEPSRNPTQEPTLSPTEPFLLLIPFPTYQLRVVLESERRRTESVFGRYLSLDQYVMERLMKELDVVLKDYMVEGLNDNFGELTAKFYGLDLMVLENAETSQQRNLLRHRMPVSILHGDSRVLKDIDEATFVVNGNATFSSHDEHGLAEQNLSITMDAAVESLFHESNNDEFLVYVQTHPDSDVLRNAVSVSASIQRAPAPSSERDSDKPGVVSIIFGFLLVVVAVISLSVYAFLFWKKMVKKRSSRKKEHGNGSQSQASFETEQISQGRTAQSLGSSKVALPISSTNTASLRPTPTTGLWIGKSWSGEDIIASQLEEAASFDRKAWDQHVRSHQDDAVEESPPEPNPPPDQPLYQKPLHRTRRDTSPYFFAESPLHDTTTLKLPDSEKRAILFAPPPADDERVHSSFIMGDKMTEPLTARDRSNTPFFSDWDDSSISDSNSEGDDGISFPHFMPSKIGQKNGQAPYKSFNPFKEVQDSESDTVLQRRNANMQAFAQQKSATQPSHSSLFEPPLFNFARETTTRFTPWSPKNEFPSTQHRNVGILSMSPPRPSLEDMSNDLESLLTDDIVQEVKTLSRFVKGYEKRRFRKDRKKSDESLLGATKRSTNRSILDVEYDLFDDRINITRHRSTQTAGGYIGREYLDDEDSISDGSSDADSYSDSESPAKSTRLGINPRAADTLGSLKDDQESQMKPHLLGVQEFFKHPKGPLSSAELNNLEFATGSPDCSESLSSSKGSSVVVEWPTNDLRYSPVLGSLFSPTGVTQQHQHRSFGSLVSMYEAKRTPPPPPPPPAPIAKYY